MESALAVERVPFFKPELSLSLWESSPDEPKLSTSGEIAIINYPQLISLTGFRFQLSLINYSSN